MDLPELDPVIHQPTRLRIMALVHKNRQASFVWVRDVLQLTDGNLGSHAAKLQDAGYIQQGRVLAASGFQVRLRITPAGDAAFRTYLASLRRYLDLEAAAAVPEHVLRQEELRDVADALLPADDPRRARLLHVFERTRIASRALANPVEWYLEPHGFQDRMAAFERVGLDLCERSAREALRLARVPAADLRGIVFVTTTGIATPSLDARLALRLGCPPDVARVPVWGLGCSGGVAGLNLAARLASGPSGGPVLLVALELCSLAFDVRRLLAGDGATDRKTLVSASLFADGCAAAVVDPRAGAVGLRHVAGTSHLWPATERLMGWDVLDHGLDVVIAPEIPEIVRARLGAVLDPFLRAHGGRRPDHWLLHPGGAKVLDAYADGLGCSEAELRWSAEVLREHGNMSSPTVLFVLQRALDAKALREGELALLGALGPGFAADFVLLEG